MIELTEEQQQALQAHPQGAPRLVNPRTGETYVLLRDDEYARLIATDYDDSLWTDEEMDLLAAEDADALGWDGMEAYQDPEP